MLWTATLAISDFLGGTFILALLFQKDNRISNRIFAFLIFLTLLHNHLYYLQAFGVGFRFPLTENLAFPVTLLFLSIAFLYLKFLITPKIILNRRDLLHLIPVGLGTVWYLAVLHFGDPSLFAYSAAYRIETYLKRFIVLIVGGIYLYLSQHLIYEYEKKLVELRSCETEISVGWLRMLLTLLYLLWASRLFAVLFLPVEAFYPFHAMVQTLMLGAITYFSLKHSKVFSECKSFDSEKQRVPRFAPEELSHQAERVRQYFEEKKPYLEPTLKLSTLATRLRLRPDQLSEILNQGLQSTFYTFVNHYRILEAKRRLLDPQYAHLSILDIALDCGFNSKSSFAEAFRRETGMAPSAFRRASAKTE